MENCLNCNGNGCQKCLGSGFADPKPVGKRSFSVIQRNPNSWTRTDRGDIHEIVEECGHRHTTLAGAVHCKAKLAPNSQFGYFARIEDNSTGRPVEDGDIWEVEHSIQTK